MTVALSIAKPVYRAAGYAFFGLGAVGAALPLLPTTGPWLLAVWLLWKGEDPLAARLLDHPRFGRALRDWFEGGRVCRTGKIAATLGMTVALCILAAANVGLVPLAAVGLGLSGIVAWLWSRPLPDPQDRS